MTSTATDLYRYFDADGNLLYVGISLSALNRAIQHKTTAGWWSQQRSMTRETYPTRQAAEDAERRAIITEKPAHNIMHNIRVGAIGEKATTLNGVEMLPTSRPSARTTDGMVGRYFLTPDPTHGFPMAEWQGLIIAEPVPGTYLVKLFSWWDGRETTQQIATIGEMSGWRFFSGQDDWLMKGQRAMTARDKFMDKADQSASR